MDIENACVPDMPAAARLFPGAPVVSMRTYVLFPTCDSTFVTPRKKSRSPTNDIAYKIGLDEGGNPNKAGPAERQGCQTNPARGLCGERTVRGEEGPHTHVRTGVAVDSEVFFVFLFFCRTLAGGLPSS